MVNTSRYGFGRRWHGFTLLDTIMVLVLVAMTTALVAPDVNRAIGRSRVRDSANVIANDLRLAVSLASRERTPVRISLHAGGTGYRITTPAGTVLRQRALGEGSELPVATMSSSVPTLEVYPNGLASGPLTITVGINGYEQRISITRAGQVRVTS